MPGIVNSVHPRNLARIVQHRVHNMRVLAESGFIRVEPPDKTLRALLAVVRWGNTPAAGYTAAAARYADQPAIVDELGTLTFGQVHERTNALAGSLIRAGLHEGSDVALMCRNHRGFIESTVACSKIGANALYLNTAFAGPQLADVVAREKADALIFDAEFASLLKEAGTRRKRFVAWHDPGQAVADPTLEQLIAEGHGDQPSPPSAPGRVVILTSGTTGTPKGAQRSQPKNLDPAVSMLSRIPLRARDRTLIAAPLFHSWGFAHFSLGLVLSSTYLLQRRFDPEATLAFIESEQAQVLIVVPVMMQRIMDLPEKTRRKYDTSSLRVTAVSGSALPGELATRWMDAFGDNLYNLYGSTEVSWATIADPGQLRDAPGTAGTPPYGTLLKLLDADGREVRRGETGRIFVANEFLFEGYTGGKDSKAVIDGLMSTGDVGRLDDAGRLFVEGRDDEMIVSGGENVFPREVEDLLARHPAVEDVAVIGVEDKEFGQRLKAFVVRKPRAKLTAEQVQAHVKEHLARYKVPRDVEFLKVLPRNATGKVLKRSLADAAPAAPSKPRRPSRSTARSPRRTAARKAGS